MWSVDFRNVGNSKQENKSQLYPNKSQRSLISQIISFGLSNHLKMKIQQGIEVVQSSPNKRVQIRVLG